MKYLIDQNLPSYFEVVEDFEAFTKLQTPIRLVVSFTVYGGRAVVDQWGIFTASGHEVDFQELAHIDQKLAVRDFERMAAQHLGFYKQDLLDWDEQQNVG